MKFETGTPPFEENILMKFYDGVYAVGRISKNSPNDETQFSEYREWTCGTSSYTEFQFYIIMMCDDYDIFMHTYSDYIVGWCRIEEDENEGKNEEQKK